jgi:hypothetical protein
MWVRVPLDLEKCIEGLSVVRDSVPLGDHRVGSIHSDLLFLLRGRNRDVDHLIFIVHKEDHRITFV